MNFISSNDGTLLRMPHSRAITLNGFSTIYNGKEKSVNENYHKNDLVWVWSNVHNKPIAGIILSAEKVPDDKTSTSDTEGYFIYNILIDEHVIKLSHRFIHNDPNDCFDIKYYVQDLIKTHIKTTIRTTSENNISQATMQKGCNLLRLPNDVLDYIFDYGHKQKY